MTKTKPKPITATIIEMLDNNNQWTWWKITREFSPTAAIRHCLKEGGLDNKQKITSEVDGFYAIDNDVRAFKINIE